MSNFTLLNNLTLVRVILLFVRKLLRVWVILLSVGEFSLMCVILGRPLSGAFGLKSVSVSDSCSRAPLGRNYYLYSLCTMDAFFTM